MCFCASEFSFLSVKLTRYLPHLSDTHTHNGYHTKPRGNKPCIQFCYRPEGVALSLSPSWLYTTTGTSKKLVGIVHKITTLFLAVFVDIAAWLTCCHGRSWPDLAGRTCPPRVGFRNGRLARHSHGRPWNFFYLNLIFDFYPKFDFSQIPCYNLHVRAIYMPNCAVRAIHANPTLTYISLPYQLYKGPIRQHAMLPYNLPLQRRPTQMATNRLHLDFTLNGTDERRNFVDQYV